MERNPTKDIQIAFQKRNLTTLFNFFYEKKLFTYSEASLIYVFDNTEIHHQHELIELIEQATKERGNEPMPTIADFLRQEGERIGFQHGLQIGREQGLYEIKKEVALKLLAEGWAVEKVAELTELSIEQVTSLLQEVVE